MILVLFSSQITNANMCTTDLHDSYVSHQVLNCGKTLNKYKLLNKRSLIQWHVLSPSRNSLQQFVVFCCEMESFLRQLN